MAFYDYREPIEYVVNQYFERKRFYNVNYTEDKASLYRGEYPDGSLPEIPCLIIRDDEGRAVKFIYGDTSQLESDEEGDPVIWQEESFEGADADDKYNFGLTVSSDVFFDEASMPDKYGKRTATCITDVGMLGTRTGTPLQAHLPKFSTNWEFADKNFITSSQWTHKYHMSDIIIFHAYDRERGKLQNVLIGDRSAIFHLDTLVIDKGKPEEKQYVMFNINAPYSILNNGPNVLYGIALRKS